MQVLPLCFTSLFYPFHSMLFNAILIHSTQFNLILSYLIFSQLSLSQLIYTFYFNYFYTFNLTLCTLCTLCIQPIQPIQLIQLIQPIFRPILIPILSTPFLYQLHFYTNYFCIVLCFIPSKATRQKQTNKLILNLTNHF